MEEELIPVQTEAELALLEELLSYVQVGVQGVKGLVTEGIGMVQEGLNPRVVRLWHKRGELSMTVTKEADTYAVHSVLFANGAEVIQQDVSGIDLGVVVRESLVNAFPPMLLS